MGSSARHDVDLSRSTTARVAHLVREPRERPPKDRGAIAFERHAALPPEVSQRPTGDGAGSRGTAGGPSGVATAALRGHTRTPDVRDPARTIPHTLGLGPLTRARGGTKVPAGTPPVRPPTPQLTGRRRQARPHGCGRHRTSGQPQAGPSACRCVDEHDVERASKADPRVAQADVNARADPRRGCRTDRLGERQLDRDTSPSPAMAARLGRLAAGYRARSRTGRLGGSSGGDDSIGFVRGTARPSRTASVFIRGAAPAQHASGCAGARSASYRGTSLEERSRSPTARNVTPGGRVGFERGAQLGRGEWAATPRRPSRVGGSQREVARVGRLVRARQRQNLPRQRGEGRRSRR